MINTIQSSSCLYIVEYNCLQPDSADHQIRKFARTAYGLSFHSVYHALST